jgi:bifunctional DNA-binding transcriptional regulator/antitoxin component of YhaV-PrlF toxin-antitoxin module
MKTTVTVRGQTVVPAKIRKDHQIGSHTQLEWIDDGADEVERLLDAAKQHGGRMPMPAYLNVERLVDQHTPASVPAPGSGQGCT